MRSSLNLHCVVMRSKVLPAPILDELSRTTGESSSFWELRDERLILLAKVERPGRFVYTRVLGRAQEPNHGFLMACLPFLPKESMERLRQRIPSSPRGEEGLDRLLEEVKTSRLLAEPASDGRELCRIAAPVFFSAKGRMFHGGVAVRGAIGITYHVTNTCSTTRMEMEAAVRTAAAAAETVLADHPM